MTWKKMACGMAAVGMLVGAPVAQGGTETFATYTNNTSSYATNSIVGNGDFNKFVLKRNINVNFLVF